MPSTRGPPWARSHPCDRTRVPASCPLLSAPCVVLLAGCSADSPTAPAATASPALSEAAAATLASEVRGPRGRARDRAAEPAGTGPRGADAARAGAGLRQDPERQPGHLLHDLPPPGIRHRGRAGASRSARAPAGLGPSRVHPGGEFIPRNAPPAFNLLALKPLFWDGRVVVDDRGKPVTPAGQRVNPHLSDAFEFGALSALPLFPVVSREEMRVHHRQRARGGE